MTAKACKLAHFEELVKIGMENIMPEKQVSIYPKDAPWMSIKLKRLIRQHQTAFHSNRKSSQYKVLRNSVNREESPVRQSITPQKSKTLKVPAPSGGRRQ